MGFINPDTLNLADYMRIAVIGPSGIGKSTLARAIGTKNNLPVTHLDALFQTDGWAMRPLADIVAAHNRCALAPAWVIEGNYHSTGTFPLRFKRAQLIVFADGNPFACAWRFVVRCYKGHGKRRVDAPQNSYETFRFGPIWEVAIRHTLLKYKKRRNRYARILAETDTPAVWLKGRRQINAFYARHGLDLGAAIAPLLDK